MPYLLLAFTCRLSSAVAPWTDLRIGNYNSENYECTSKGAFPLTLISDRLKEDVEANDDPSPTRDPTGIAQAGWKEEEGVEDRSELRKEIETETETGMCVLCG